MHRTMRVNRALVAKNYLRRIPCLHESATVPSKVLSASLPPSLQQGPKGAQRMMKGCSKVAYAFVTLLITYSSAANTSTAQSSFLNFLQIYYFFLKYANFVLLFCQHFIFFTCFFEPFVH